MPDIIEENEGDGTSQIERRVEAAARGAAAVLLARAAVAANNANHRHHHGNHNNNNNNNNNDAGRVAAVIANNNNHNNNIVPAVPPEAAAAVVQQVPNNPDNNNNGSNNPRHHARGGRPAAAAAEPAIELAQMASHVARLVGVDVRTMFRRLGVKRLHDIRYIREKDFDGIPGRITMIQKRKLWAIMKFVATDHVLTSRTTLTEIARALNVHKKREKEDATSTTSAIANSSSTSATAAATLSSPSSATTTAALALLATSPTGATVMPLVHTSKIDPFDGFYGNWMTWKNKTRYALSQTTLGGLLRETTADEAKQFSKKSPGQDHLLFNVLAEAIVGGSAKHLIRKAETETRTQTSADAGSSSSSRSSSSNKAKAGGGSSSSSSKSAAASGRILWQLLLNEYSQGPMAFWILSDARQTLQKLRLVCPPSSKAAAATTDNLGDNGDENDDSHNKFTTHSAQDYVQKFRNAKDTLEEYQQALPDQFLSSTFVEHIYDERLDTAKKQLLQDISIKHLSLDACINELLMADHMIRTRHHHHRRQNPSTIRCSSSGNSSGVGKQKCRKRPLQDEEAEGQLLIEQQKRIKVSDNNNNNDNPDDGAADNNNDEPEEAAS